MSDNWLSTDEQIREVCDQAVKEYGGSDILSIRCPTKEIQAKVRKYLDSKRGGKTIDTYVGALNDNRAGMIDTGHGTRSKTRSKKGDSTPIELEGEGDDTPDQDIDHILDQKHYAQMADLTPDDDLDGLV